MEWREQQYNLRLYLSVFTSDCASVPVVSRAITYVASHNPDSNPAWLGPAEPEAIAQQIARARGVSGWNCEYLHNLAKAMKRVSHLAPFMSAHT